VCGGIVINKIRLSIVILALGLVSLMSTALAAPHHGGDWLSPGGEISVHHSSWHSGYPYSSWHYPSSWYYSTPVYYNSWYNSFDPWWASNVYGPYRTTYYYWGW
jgi:hypothetical protein